MGKERLLLPVWHHGSAEQAEPEGLQPLYAHAACSPQTILWALGRLGRVSSVVRASPARSHFHLLLGSGVLNVLPAMWLPRRPLRVATHACDGQTPRCFPRKARSPAQISQKVRGVWGTQRLIRMYN